MKKSKWKKEAENKLKEYLKKNINLNINSTNTADNEQGGYKETRMD
tara:strand:+ start:186 stop:323 length:138 start_codon:yes stop_codon:yes gene_type:complete